MATYIPQLTDNTQQIPVAATMPQSNYQFLQSQMDKANAMYESGFQEVKSGYASIVNAPVTGIEINKRKQKYIQDAQNKLRTLSSKDLSLPQNVMQAETAYAPFWEDDLLLQNVAETRRQAKGISQLDSWLYSTDENTRALYSDDNRRAFQKAQSILANTPLNKEAYAKTLSDLQSVRAIPYYDINKDAEESWKNQYGTGIDKGISTVHLGGGAMVTEFNGPNSYQAYKTWFTSQMLNDPKYAPQLRQQAWLEVQDRREQVMRENPGIAPDQVDNLLAKNRMKELQDISQNSINTYSELMDSYANKINDLHRQVYVNQKGNWDQSQKAQEQMLQQQLQQYTKLWDNAKTQSMDYIELIDGKPNERYLKTISDIATNPVGYVANINADRIASIWAQGKSSITSEKIEVDPIEHENRFWQNEDRKHWIETQKLKLDNAKVMQEERKMALTARGQDYDLYKATGQLTPFGKVDPRFRGGSGSGKGGWASANWNGIPDPQVTPHTVDVQQVDVINKAQSAIKEPLQRAMGTALDINSGGFGAIVLGDNGLKLTDKGMDIFRNYMNSMMENGKVPPTPEEAAEWNKVKDSLVKAGVVKSPNDITGPMTMYGALNRYAQKVSNELIASEDDNKKNLAGILALAGQRMKTDMDQYHTAQSNYNKAIEQYLTSGANGETNPLAIIENGKRRLVQGKDIQKDVPSVELVSGNEKLNMTSKELADAVTTGRIEIREPESLGSHTSGLFESDWDIKVDGVKYKVNKLTAPENAKITNLTLKGITKERPKDLIYQEYGWDQIGDRNNRADIANALWNYMNSTKVGNINEFSSKWKNANVAVASKLGYKNGIIYQAMSWDPNNEDDQQSNYAINLAKEFAPISNTTSFYEYKDGENTPSMFSPTGDADLIASVRNVLSSTPEIKDKVSRIDVIKDLGEVAVTFRPQYGAEDKKDKFAGKTIYMKLTPTAKGKLLDAIPSGIVSGPFAGLYNGDVYKSSELMNNAGNSYTLTPVGKGVDGRPTSVIYNSRYINERGVDTTMRETIPFVGPNAKTPMEIYQWIQQMDAAYLNNRQTQRKVQAQKLAAGIPTNSK